MTSLPLPSFASTFKDVYKYKEEIHFLTSKGIITGYKDGTFKPENPINRLQAVQMILREKGITNYTAPNPHFSDLQPGDYGYNEVAKAVSMGLISGKSDSASGRKYFDPYGTLTRAQMAKILVLAYDLEGKHNRNFYDVPRDDWAYEFVSALAANKITTGYGDGSFRPSINLSRQHFAVFMARNLDDRFIEEDEGKDLTTAEISQLNDSKVVLIQTQLNNGTSLGSGVIIGDGLILTNQHVIEGMKSGTIYLHDGTPYKIEGIIASDAKKDLALLKTKEKVKNSQSAIIGTYQSLEKGDKVVAIGSPKGLQNTVSEGIVSSIRVLDGVRYIQTSAPIDHGSSGGGLFNARGELVGITTWKVRDNTANLNFAVAIDETVEWGKYFAMKFEQIKVAPIENPVPSNQTLPVPGFTNIALGMTKEQVKSLEKSKLFREDTNTLMYTNKTVLDFTARVVYEFNNNKLTAINVYHDLAEGQDNLDTLEKYFVVIHDKLSAIYGKPTILDLDWFDDDDGYVLNAFWEMSQYDLLLIVHITFDYSTSGGIRIASS